MSILVTRGATLEMAPQQIVKTQIVKTLKRKYLKFPQFENYVRNPTTVSLPQK